MFRILIAAPDSVEARKLRTALDSHRECVARTDVVHSWEGFASLAGQPFDAVLFDPSLAGRRPLDSVLEEWPRATRPPLLWLGDGADAPIARDGSNLSPLWRALGKPRAPSDPVLRSIEREMGELAWHFDDGLAVYDIAEGRLVYASPAFEKIWRLSRFAALEDMDVWLRTFHDQDRPRVEAALAARPEAETFSSECRIVWPNGCPRWISLRVVPWRDASGAVRRLSIVATDITTHKETETALRAEQERRSGSEKKYRLLFESNPVPMFLFDLETLTYVEVNDAAVAKYGYSRDEFLRMSVMDIRPREDEPRLREALRLLGPGVQHLGDWRHRLKDGRLIDVEILAESMEPEGRRAVLIAALDVTAQRRAQRREEADHAITAILADAPTIPDAVPRVLQVLGENLGWDYAAGWSAPGWGPDFGCAYSWASPSFGPLDPRVALASDDPLLQRVVSSKAPVWAPDFSAQPGFAPALARLGLRCGAALPVSAGDSDWAVIALFAREPRTLDEEHRRLLQTAAARLGQFIERKRADETLRFNEERTRLLMANALDAVIDIDATGLVTGWNAQAERVFGWSREEILGRELASAIVPPEERERYRAGLARFLATGEGVILNRRMELTALRRDGARMLLELSITPVNTRKGWVFTAFARDISLRKQAEEKLRSQTALLESILRHIADGVLVAGLGGDLLLVNEAADRICGMPIPREVRGRSRELGLYCPDRQTPFRDEDLPTARAARGEAVDEVEIYVCNDALPEGRWLLCSARPIVVAEGDPVAGVTVIRDNTDRKRAEETMRSAKEAAESANRQKGEFLANVSHELRTPLNGILGMIELALSTELNAEQREFLNMARESAENQLAVVNDVLDFAKIESGRFSIHPIPFDPREHLKTSLGTLAVRAERKGLAFACDVNPRVPPLVIGDPVRLRQILLNLAGNAFKFTERGSISVSVEVDAAQASGVTLSFIVSDTGIGIPAGKLDLIFQPFTQADGSLSRRYTGTGLGLSIASDLVERMGGRISVESVAGQGSRFMFTAKFGIPAAAEQAAAASPKAAPSRRAPIWTGRPLHVLLAEDNPVNQRLAARLLEAEGHTVVKASDGHEALRAYRAQPLQFDLALLDLQMPSMDGFGVAAAIREAEGLTGRRLPILALTAHAADGYRERCLAAGMDGYLAKPFRSRQLLEAIASVLGGQTSATG